MTTISEIENEIRIKVRRDAEVKRGLDIEAKKVQEYWRSVSPVRTGAYAASIRIRRGKRVDGMPTAVVVATDYKAHWIEFGTKADPVGTHSKFGPNTPTPAFAPRAKTAAHFGGDETAATDEDVAA
jgi:hypothetical protein